MPTKETKKEEGAYELLLKYKNDGKEIFMKYMEEQLLKTKRDISEKPVMGVYVIFTTELNNYLEKTYKEFKRPKGLTTQSMSKIEYIQAIINILKHSPDYIPSKNLTQTINKQIKQNKTMKYKSVDHELEKITREHNKCSQQLEETQQEIEYLQNEILKLVLYIKKKQKSKQTTL